MSARSLPLPVLAVLGLSACRGCGKDAHTGPCLSVVAPPPDGGIEALVCLSPAADTATPCLEPVAPCLSIAPVEPEKLQPDVCLSIIPVPAPPEPEPESDGDGDQGALPSSRDTVLTRVIDQGSLPDDVARRLLTRPTG